jgi:hypothetical protein
MATYIWQQWNGTGTTSAATVKDAWIQWTSASNTTASTSYFVGASEIWNTWQTGTTSNVHLMYPQQYADPYANETPEAREERLLAQAVAAEQRARRERRRRIRSDVAVVRAQRLLHSVLSDEQLAEFERTKAFTLTVIDSRTGVERRFRINEGKAGNVTEVDEDGHALAKYCVHLYGHEPMEILCATRPR